MAKVKFTTADGYDRVQFYAADGTEVVVDASGYQTDDPSVIAYLDSHPAAKRAKSSAKSSDGGKG